MGLLNLVNSPAVLISYTLSLSFLQHPEALPRLIAVATAAAVETVLLTWLYCHVHRGSEEEGGWRGG